MSNKRTYIIPTIMLVVMIFAGHLLKFINYYLMYMSIMIVVLVITIINKEKIILKNKLFWFLSLLITLISIAYSPEPQASLKYSYLLLCSIITMILFEKKSGWQEFFINICFIASGFHVFITIMELFIPSLIMRLNFWLMKPEDYTQSLIFLSRGIYSGITGQTGINSFYISVFISIVFCRIITEFPKKTKLIIFLIFGIIALLLTAKRSQLIINFLIIFIISLMTISKNDTKRKFRVLIIPIFIIGIGYLILLNIPGTSVILEKSKFLSESNDFTNGRIDLWYTTFNLFKENPILGIGINSISRYINESTHNIYLQLLSEVGIIGFIFFITSFLVSLIDTIRVTKYLLKIKNANLKSKSSILVSLYLQIHFLLYGFVGNPLYGTIFLGIYMQMIAISYAYLNEIKIEINKNKILD